MIAIELTKKEVKIIRFALSLPIFRALGYSKHFETDEIDELENFFATLEAENETKERN